MSLFPWKQRLRRWRKDGVPPMVVFSSWKDSKTTSGHHIKRLKWDVFVGQICNDFVSTTSNKARGAERGWVIPHPKNSFWCLLQKDSVCRRIFPHEMSLKTILLSSSKAGFKFFTLELFFHLPEYRFYLNYKNSKRRGAKGASSLRRGNWSVSEMSARSEEASKLQRNISFYSFSFLLVTHSLFFPCQNLVCSVYYK